MKGIRLLMIAGALGAVGSAPAMAQSDTSPGRIAHGRKVSGVPSDALGKCKDGVFVSTGMKATACSMHGGTRIWYSDGVPNTTPESEAMEHRGPGAVATGRDVGGIPSDALGKCNDGTFVSTGTKTDSCTAHGGLKIWYSDGVPNN